MPITYDADPESGAALAKGSGVVTLDEVRELIGTYVNDDRLATPHRELFDMRGVETYSLNAADTQSLADFVSTTGDRFQGARVAFIAGDDLAFGMARMIEVFAERIGIELRAFRDYDEGKLWLEQPSESRQLPE